MDEGPPRWLLLIHQIPPKPNYLRVKIWRRLQRLGAVAIKNSVYVLPRSDAAQEDFHLVQREIVADGGDASICEARFVEGLSDEQVETLFRVARDADYAQVAEEARAVASRFPKRAPPDADQRGDIEGELSRLRRRMEEIAAIDFCDASGREAAARLIAGIEDRLAAREVPNSEAPKPEIGPLRNRIWVTRKGIHVDRIGSAWLIRRFIDPKAKFKFVPGKGYRPEAGELRFDMFEAEFTHEGDRCSFEVLLLRAGVDDPALRPIAEIIHDIDLKDSKFGREETVGVDRLIAGIAMGHKDDEARLERGSALFDDLYEYFRRKGP
jgi:hypothetical protein